MYLVVGLGNPGSKYARTRHNVGFDVVELLAHRLNVTLSKLKCKALLAEAKAGSERVIIAQPQTFMNLSGESVVELANWYKVPVEHIIICYDDIDLELGALRVRAKGSAGTHNGMRSIVYLLGKDNFPRVRVGIGRPAPGWDLADHVLSSYRTPAERELAFGGYQDAVDVILELIAHGTEAATRMAADKNAVRYPKEAKPKKEKASGNKINFNHIGRHAWDQIRAGRLSGASCCITIDGKTAYQGIFGSANVEMNEKLKKDSIFRLASMTKPVTAVAVMMMKERGQINLDAPVSDILPELSGWRVRGGNAPLRPVTARDLLTHSSGLAQEAGEAEREKAFRAIAPEKLTLEAVVKAYASLELDFEPGTRTGYSPAAAFDVLARMVEVQAKVDFADFVKIMIFEPLGMKDTTWYPTEAQWARTVPLYALRGGALERTDIGRVNFMEFPVSYSAGCAGLMSTLPDYVRFAQMLLSEGELDGVRILEKESVREMRTPQLSREKTANLPEYENWGLGMRVITAPVSPGQPMTKGCFGWSGVYGTHFWVDPEKKLTAVYMSNVLHEDNSEFYTPEAFEQDVYDALRT